MLSLHKHDFPQGTRCHLKISEMLISMPPATHREEIWAVLRLGEKGRQPLPQISILILHYILTMGKMEKKTNMNISCLKMYEALFHHLVSLTSNYERDVYVRLLQNCPLAASVA